jgi:hypothetical protein
MRWTMVPHLLPLAVAIPIDPSHKLTLDQIRPLFPLKLGGHENEPGAAVFV